MLIDDGAVFTTSDATVWQDAGTTEALLDTNRYLLDRSETTDRHDGALVIQPSLIDSTASIEGSVIGPYASVGPHAIVSASIVRDSIIDAGSSVQNVNVAHSIVGRDAVVRGASLVLNIGDTSVVDLRTSDDA